jgi:transcriptional regulator with XRE-family HTH domain
VSDIYDTYAVEHRHRRALELIDELVFLDPDPGTTAYALKLRERLKLPMPLVLEKLWPDASISEKVRRLGVTRQTYYGWLNGLFRPEGELAKKIAKLTGFDEEEIRGHRLLRER